MHYNDIIRQNGILKRRLSPMKNIKIAFFDIDGTLIDMNTKVISKKTLEMLARLQKNNIKICIATGRAPSSLPPIPDIAFDAYLTFNGSYCYSKKHVIFSNPLQPEDVTTILQNAAELHRPVSIATRDRLSANGKDEDLVQYYKFSKSPFIIPENFEEITKEDIYQIMLGSCLEEHIPLMKNVKNARITYWWERAVDIIPKDGGKGVGVKKILSYYNLTEDEAIAFGDGNNDIELLQSVGLGVAMENASEQLKAVAKDQCGHVAADGIYHYCMKHGLI